MVLAAAPTPSSRTHDRDELVHRYLPLARRLAARYRYSSEPLEDLVQVASMALVIGAHRFDPDRGTNFASFAVPTILGELRRHLRDHGWAARVPRGLQENVLRVTAARDDLSGGLGRAPRPAELADHTGLDVQHVLEAIEAGAAYDAESLDQSSMSEDDVSESLHGSLGTDEPGYELVEYGVAVRPAWAKLSLPERAVVRMRFIDDMTQSQIATRIGVSQMQVSRLLRRALDRLQEAVGGGAAEQDLPTAA
jgi:RNA polymerase sigma-B factor